MKHGEVWRIEQGRLTHFSQDDEALAILSTDLDSQGSAELHLAAQLVRTSHYLLALGV